MAGGFSYPALSASSFPVLVRVPQIPAVGKGERDGNPCAIGQTIFFGLNYSNKTYPLHYKQEKSPAKF